MKKKEEKKDLFKLILLVLAIINSLGLILLSISNINIKKEIKDLKKEEQKEEQKEEVWSNEDVNSKITKGLVGTWRYNGGNNIYILEIDEKGNFISTYYTNVYNKNATGIKAEDIDIKEIDKSEYQLQYGQKGYIEYSTMVIKEIYSNGEWKETNASTTTIRTTSEITLKTGKYTFEYTKQ